MKTYALERHDGGIEVMTIIPHAAMIEGHPVPMPVAIRDGKPAVLLSDPSLVGRAVELIYAAPEELIAKWPADRQAQIASVRGEIGRNAVPQDRTFRGAWEWAGDKVGTNMPKARDIHREHLRKLRAPKLAALDVEYQRADEANDNKAKADIAKKKQALRDVTADPAIDAAETPDQLKVVLPDALNGAGP